MAERGRLIQVDGPKLGHIPAFDGFRGVFVMQVLMFHAHLTDFFVGSEIVIDWFFVASGFLITSLLLDERRATGGNNLRTFYQRRALRLFPAMYLLILVFVVIMTAVTLLVPSVRDDLGLWWVEALSAATYCYYIVYAFMPGEFAGALGHTWTLTVEEQFYFLWPLFLTLGLRGRRRASDRTLILGAIGFIAVVMGTRMALQHTVVQIDPTSHFGEYYDLDDPTWQGIVYRITRARPDVIVLGCLLAFVNRAIPRPVPERIARPLKYLAWASWVTYLGFWVVGNRVPGFELWGGVGYQFAILMLCPMILDLYLRSTSYSAKLFSLPILCWFGVRSYGIYLWHVPVLFAFLPAIENAYGVQRLVLGMIAVVLGVLAGIASFRFIEQPFLRLKESRFRRPQDVVTQGSSSA